jgi:hypothetical protein
MRSAYNILILMPEGRYHLDDLEADDRIVLKWILKK